MTLKSVDTLLDVLHFADSHTAVIVPEMDIRVTNDSLRQQVLAMADALASAGIRRGDRVALDAPPASIPRRRELQRCGVAGNRCYPLPVSSLRMPSMYSW